MLDIVGSIEGFEELGVERVYNWPVALGSGWVDAAHGRLPVPAPATAVLLEGVRVTTGGVVEGEATTPTGATLVRVLSEGPPPPRWRVVASGWGAGQRDPATYANALRVIVGEDADEAGRVIVLAADVDDMSPEYVEPLRQALTAAGAFDVETWPVHMKKGRVGFRIEVVAPESFADQVTAALFRHSTTAGVRRSVAERATLTRREIAVRLAADVTVRVKVLEQPDGERLKAEYDDVLAAAQALGKPALEIARGRPNARPKRSSPSAARDRAHPRAHARLHGMGGSGGIPIALRALRPPAGRRTREPRHPGPRERRHNRLWGRARSGLARRRPGAR